MGPWIVTGADIDAMQTTIRLNGRVTETFKTNNMIFDAPTYISEVSRYCTIEPGDVMWMGTDGIPANMKAGGVCEIEISGIGVLSNRVFVETYPHPPSCAVLPSASTSYLLVAKSWMAGTSPSMTNERV